MRGVALMALLCLAACGSGQRMDGDADGDRAKAVKAPPAKVQLGQPEIIRVMDGIPVARKGEFQRALACEVRRNAARERPAIAIDAKYLADLDRRLRKNPKLASC